MKKNAIKSLKMRSSCARVTPINNVSVKPDWSIRKGTSKGHTESHQIISLSKENLSAICADVVRIVSQNGIRFGTVHHEGKSLSVKELVNKKARYWEVVC